MIIVKEGDTHEISWITNVDLTGTTVKLTFRKTTRRSGEALPAPTDENVIITDALNGKVTHRLSGDLVCADYQVEVEITRGLEIVTAPNEGYEYLRVEKDLI
jgi:hypothetical protein